MPHKKRQGPPTLSEPQNGITQKQPTLSHLDAPEGLDDATAAEWRRVTSLRAFRQGELTLLKAYIFAWMKWTQAEARLAVEGPTLRQPLPKGRFKIVENPLTVVVARYQRSMLAAARQLKLSAAVSTNEIPDTANWVIALDEIDTLTTAEWEAKFGCSQRAWLGGEITYLPGELLLK